MFFNRCYETENNTSNMMPAMTPNCNPCCPKNVCPPVMECPEERICHTESYYEVPHIIPINTRIIRHHIYRHTYQPCYTCTMEDDVSNVYENRCNF